MKYLNCIVVSIVSSLIPVVSSVGAQSAAQKPDQPALKIVLATAHPVVSAGSDIWLEVSVTNNSEQEISEQEIDDSGGFCDRTSLDPNFCFDVRDDSGKSANERKYAHPELDRGKAINRTIPPGQTLIQDQRVSELYDLSEPGKYIIRVSMRVPDALGRGIVTSNPLVVTVAEPGLIADIHVEAKEIPLLLGDLLRETDWSGGVAEELDCSNLPRARLDVKQGTSVQDAMDSFVAENPGYRWVENMNVVNVMATIEFPLLNTRIPRFELDTTDDKTPARGALFQLLNLPQIRQRAAELSLKPGLMQGWLEALLKPGYRKVPRPIRVNLYDVSLQEAFNSIVRAYGNWIWVYEERQCNGERTYLVRATQ
jgi:hypothetical protein